MTGDEPGGYDPPERLLTPTERLLAERLKQAMARLRRVMAMHKAGRMITLDYPYFADPRDLSSSPSIARLRRRFESERAGYRRLLAEMLALAEPLSRIPADAPAGAGGPHWRNGWLPPLDAASLYALTVRHRPRLYLEVGSGNSTLFVRRAIEDHGLDTRIVSIDPKPRAEVDAICDEVVRTPLEQADLSVFERLGPGDILFVDNSHRAFPGSDVTVFFMEVIGRLSPGVVYGLHDILLPDDYPEHWSRRFYNEQYLLAAYLFGGAGGDEIVFPGRFVGNDPELAPDRQALFDALGLPVDPAAGAFWLRKA